MRKKIRVPVIKIIRALLPVIKNTVNAIVDAREEDSDEGKKVTRDEWEDILAEALLDIVPNLAKLMEDANK